MTYMKLTNAARDTLRELELCFGLAVIVPHDDGGGQIESHGPGGWDIEIEVDSNGTFTSVFLEKRNE